MQTQRHEYWGPIERKPTVPDEDRTDAKDEVADFIEGLVDRDEWPVEQQRVADATGWSRSHVSNVLRDYFRPVGEGRDEQNVTISVPDDVDESSYLRGFVDCYTAQ